ncbi:serine hydrolase [Deinococcus radiophilus]|uniref:Serine hydrolase n=1 Tax=Deinococcus radiophilus TaxID=32062 RepID=A0A431VPS2_9DEIO|nr:serine hydrolase [Deinococcus radiophilus]RTR25219.1 serine hydrolase [Deinococcus radiophilus]UFA50253.1 class A beta-lactamase-related serine hydrolase [Deinococcus radiophilus]
MTVPNRFEAALHQSGFGGTVGLLIQDETGHEICSLNADRVFPAASLIKVPLLILGLQAVQRGGLALEDRLPLPAAEQVPGAGVLHELGPGLFLSWQDLLTLMIIVSDNTATNVVIDCLRLSAVQAALPGLGLAHTRLVGKLQQPPERYNAAQRRGERNQTTPRDMLRLLQRLRRGEYLDPVHTALALDILGRQQLRDLIGRRVPCGADGEPLYRVLSKSGELTGVHHDVGWLLTPRPLAVACLSQGGEDAREHPENRDVLRLADALWPVLEREGFRDLKAAFRNLLEYDQPN